MSTRSIHFTRTVAALATIASAAGCSGTNDATEATVGEETAGASAETTIPLFMEADGTTLWNGASAADQSALGTSAVVPVCFAVRPQVRTDGSVWCGHQTSQSVDCNGSSFSTVGDALVEIDTSFLRQKIKSTVESTWARYGNIEFIDWGDCPIDAATGKHQHSQLANRIVIHFAATAPPGVAIDWASQNGKNTAAAPTGIQFNWPSVQLYGKGNIIHEFGHALGFEHEWRRGDFYDDTCSYSDKNQADAGSILLSPFYDTDSIMNYCGNATRPDDGTLSAGDIIGVQRAYGRKSRGSLVSAGGLCAGVYGGSSDIGTPIITYPCRNQFNDLWVRSTSTNEFQANLSSTVQRCMNVSGGVVSPTTPTPVGTWPCVDTANESFPLSNVEWRGMGRMCATAAYTSTHISIQMQNCVDDSPWQKWTFMDGDPSTPLGFDQIRSEATGLCVSTETTNGELGGLLYLTNCSASDARQRFQFPGHGIIAYGDYCMNVSGGVPTSGSHLGLWNGCSLTPRHHNSQFTLAGQMKSLGQCLDATTPSQVSVTSCTSGNSAQWWEYYL